MLANHVLISIFELGSKLSNIIAIKTVTTQTFGGVLIVFWCYSIKLSLLKQSRPKYVIIVSVVTKVNKIFIFGEINNFNTVIRNTVLQIFCALACKLKFCNVMWSLQKHYCHYRKCAVTNKTWDVLSKIKHTELSPEVESNELHLLTLL